ncbi:Hsp70 family protein [Dactylosporangium sp. NPDC051484]|uniref:Hsp70 family protein n=1 Tax=Dactylosporangium sp. NPDC051484 TaxID=3154942 RepID=UPI00344F8289
MYPFAIDLGTSNTVAVLRGADGQIRPLLFDGREQLSSAVYAGADGALIVGTDAERLARADPAAFEPNPKRRVDDGTVLLGSHTIAVTDTLAAVLLAVVEQVNRVGQPGPAVLTVPSTWAASRRAVLAAAAVRAGLGTVTLISEPIAAAAYYASALRHGLPPDGALLVVDVGAGTADVALVRASAAIGAGSAAPDTALSVIAQQGLDIGGLDVDAALVGVLGQLVSGDAPEAWRRLAAPATNAERRDRLVLWQEVRAAKESLSRLSVAPVHMPGYPTDLHLTREELEVAATPLLAPVAEVAAQMVATAGLAPHDLAGVFLVGGGSRMPLLGRLLHARLGVAPTVAERPETVVAEGAIQAQPTMATVPVVAPSSERVATAPSGSTPRRTPIRRRWLSPATLVLALLCFVLPFATVSCVPDSYGRAKPGGTTEYNGLDLALGGKPHVQPDHLRPPTEWREDRIEPQPFYAAALLVLGAALVTALTLTRQRRRRALVAGLGALAGLSLVAGQVLVVNRLADRIREQSAVPAGQDARDFVGTGAGFWLTLVLLALLVAGNLAALLPLRRLLRRWRT